MRTKKAASEDVAPMRPTLSPEVRENQMISLAMDLWRSDCEKERHLQPKRPIF